MTSARSRSAAPIIIVLAALAGAWVSGTLLKEHDGGWRRDGRSAGLLSRLCESQTIPDVNCAGVVGGRWASFDFAVGSRLVVVPTSWLGLAYFVFLAVWFAMAAPFGRQSKWIRRVTLSVVSGGLAGSLLFTALMAFAPAEWCLLCLAAHGLNAVVFVATVWAWRSERRPVAVERSTQLAVESSALRLERRLAWSAALTGGGAALAMWLYFDAVTEARRQWRKVADFKEALAVLQDDPQLMLSAYFAQAVKDIPEHPDRDSDGLSPSQERVAELALFTDYDCGPCACFESTLQSLVRESFGGNIHVDIRHYPAALAQNIRQQTNDPEDGSVLPAPSYAAEAARLQGGDYAFALMHRLLFQHRRERPDRDYADLACQVGLDEQRLLTDMGSDAVQRKVRQDLELADRLGVESVPALFLNGRRVPDLCLESGAFWQAVAAELVDQQVLATVDLGAS